MKKTSLFIWGIIVVICFASCSKENVQPNNEKKASTNQSSSSQEAPPPSTPPSTGCPHTAPPCCPQAPANPMNPMNMVGY